MACVMLARSTISMITCLRMSLVQLLRGATRGLSSSAELRAAERFPSYVMNAPATEVTRLSNGVRVATEVSTRARLNGTIVCNHRVTARPNP